MSTLSADISTDMPNPIPPDFWVRDADAIDADLATLRSAPITFHPEPEAPPELGIVMGPGAWVATRHADILEISKQPGIFSSAAGITVIDAPPEFNEFFGSMISMDDPRHARLRKLVSAGFTPRMLAKLHEIVIEQADTIIDEVAERGECDFVVDVAARLPLKIVCDLMGIPDSELDFVFDQTNMVLGSTDPEYLPDASQSLEALLGAGAALAGLMENVAASKRGGSSDDLTTILANAEVDGERLSAGDIASFFILLVVAGNETTRNAISWGLRYLTDNPEQRQIWQSDIDGVSASAIEEIVRLASPVTYMRRTLTQDAEVGGVEMSEGDKILLFYIAANRDERVFSDPHGFDVRRDPNPHVGFGGPGPHFCLGAHLARREIQVMFSRLFARLPDIQASGEASLLQSSFIHGIKHLPASFTPAAPRS